MHCQNLSFTIIILATLARTKGQIEHAPQGQALKRPSKPQANNKTNRRSEEGCTTPGERRMPPMPLSELNTSFTVSPPLLDMQNLSQDHTSVSYHSKQSHSQRAGHARIPMCYATTHGIPQPLQRLQCEADFHTRHDFMSIGWIDTVLRVGVLGHCFQTLCLRVSSIHDSKTC